MPKSLLKILYLEDSAFDAELISRILKKSELNFVLTHVENRHDYELALRESTPDIILSDHTLYQFNSLDALKILKESGFRIPFILVTGSVSEEFAVNILKEGADDYLLKSNLGRLPNAIQNSLKKSNFEKEREKYLQDLIAKEALMNSAERVAGFGSWENDLINGKSNWSDGLYTLLGFDSNESLASPESFMKLVHREDIERFDSDLKAATLKSDLLESEFRIIDRKGVVKDVYTKVVFERNEKGKPLKRIGFCLDISERKKAENELKVLNEDLRIHAKNLAVSNTELEQFAYVASHDLQEPLRMITSFLTLLEKKYEDKLDSKGQKYIHFAVDGAKRMRKIVLDLLEYSKAGKTDNQNEIVNVNELIDEILILYKKQISDSKAKITYSALPSISIAKTPLRQVFQNLISNSLKYCKEDRIPKISIKSRTNKTHWHFTISDNGIGIDSEYFKKIFIIFQRLHNKDEFSGTGMGLAVTKKIIDHLSGEIWLESEPDEGTTFHFTIPKQQKPNE